MITNLSVTFNEILSSLCLKHNLSINDKVILINNNKVELDEEINKYIINNEGIVKIRIGTMSGYLRNEKNRLMIEKQKMKRICKGDNKIENNNRMYYNIKYDDKIYSIFIDKKYSVGKIIDYFCKLFGIVNYNANGKGYIYTLY